MKTKTPQVVEARAIAKQYAFMTSNGKPGKGDNYVRRI